MSGAVTDVQTETEDQWAPRFVTDTRGDLYRDRLVRIGEAPDLGDVGKTLFVSTPAMHRLFDAYPHYGRCVAP